MASYPDHNQVPYRVGAATADKYTQILQNKQTGNKVAKFLVFPTKT